MKSKKVILVTFCDKISVVVASLTVKQTNLPNPFDHQKDHSDQDRTQAENDDNHRSKIKIQQTNQPTIVLLGCKTGSPTLLTRQKLSTKVEHLKNEIEHHEQVMEGHSQRNLNR